jgi:DNA-binding CsgD family transcriptional regulator
MVKSKQNQASSGGEKNPHGDLLSEFENEFERNHPTFMHDLREEYGLTAQELRVCAMIRSNMKSNKIADLLSISLSTVSTHRTNIHKKMGLKKTGLREFLLSNF